MTGAGGEGAAMKAAKDGASVAVIERAREVGGGCVHWATIPSKALRHSVGQFLDLFFIKDGIRQIGRLMRNASGDLTETGKHFVPESERGKVVWASRVYLAIRFGVIIWCVAIGSICLLYTSPSPRD